MRRRKTAIFFVILGVCLIALAAALNVGWILLNVREVALLVFGIIFFALIITGLSLNTIFLVREIRRNEKHDTFLNSVTHELKTPIASIKLYLDTLKNREVSEEKRQEFYDIMLSDSDRLLGTVEQVLHASRTGEKQRQLNRSSVDLGNLLGETVEITRTRNHLANDAIRFTRPSEPVELVADRAELQTAFANLLDNAVKYSDGTPRISIKLKTGGSRADIYIKDNGRGIARADLKRVFKRFYRVPSPEPDAVKGSGLGLAIVKAVIEKQGGKITAESKGPGTGTTFLVRLPIK